MHYDYALAIPANTQASAPVSVDMDLTHGVITRVEISFPPGCAGLAHVRLNRAIHQVYPDNPDGDYNEDGTIIVIDDWREWYEAPYVMTMWGYNLDDTFDHTITARINVIPKAIAERGQQTESLLSRLSRAIIGR